MSEPSNDAAHLHSYAKEARTIAELLKIADANGMMYRIAGDFERRAAEAERRVADQDTGKSH
jgi:hypothetical protein